MKIDEDSLIKGAEGGWGDGEVKWESWARKTTPKRVKAPLFLPWLVRVKSRFLPCLTYIPPPESITFRNEFKEFHSDELGETPESVAPSFPLVLGL
jgi:hypothetical protein